MELLAPAGNREKLETAFRFGADACYFAGKKYGLRAFSDNFNQDELSESIAYAHSLGKKAYITLNIVAHNSDFTGLKQYIKYLEKAKADAVIVSDIGIINLVRKTAPKLKVHVSTQANVTNKYAAKVLADMGVTRIILARELSLEEIKEIRAFIPKKVELEAFVHGAMCISYSGRCLLSNYLTGRDGNRGACVQACRWEYSITEKSRHNGSQYEIQEDDRGTYILNSKDLNMIEHIDKLAQAGVTSFKIEGRMKSPYYVATVVNAYRRAITALEENSAAGKKYACPKVLKEELLKTSHRGYSTGFFLGAKDKESLESSLPVQTHEFMAMVLADAANGYALIEQRNRFAVGETLEVLSSTETFNKKIKITKMLNEQREEVSDAKNVQQKLLLKTSLALKKGDILRKKIEE